jgi:ATP-binding cassette subfamily F protein uup
VAKPLKAQAGDCVALIQLHDIHYSIGAQALLEGVSFQVAPRERIGLLGRNGQGKSTLLRILAGELEPDRGRREVSPGLRLRRLAQEVPELPPGKVFAAVAAGLGERGRLQLAYRDLARRAAESPVPEILGRLAEVQQALESAGGWIADHEVERVLTPLGLDPETATTVLSAGFKRRVLLAQALVAAPEVLLLDEPTNHLDLVTIQWLEETLLKTDGALVLVTHDRAVLQALATRIVELDRGRLYAFPGGYAAFLARKEAAQAAEEGQAAHQDRELAREEAWIRQGVKARRRRNQGRVRALERLREERRQRRDALGDVRLRLQVAERSGKLVLAAEGVSHRWGDRRVLQDVNTVISRGDRVGIVGPNGAGKTTLLQILLGRLAPERGKVRHGTHLQVAYFDQLRAQLDEERSVADNVAQGNDRIVFNGRPRHVMGYLSDFLFTVERARQPVKALSGGEKNRLLLARLFARPANLLVLDEPTNDLDLETLELLEERLYDYEGTILVVSHDRVFLDQVATGILAFEGDGRVREYVGGYSDWQRQRQESEVPPPAPPPKPLRLKTPPPGPPKLTFKERKELEALPGTIERLEAEQADIFAALGDPAIYKGLGATVAGFKARLGDIEKALAAAYARWEELEGRAGS